MNNRWTSRVRRKAARHGWTLIESIAVLAVIALLAAVLVPPIIKRVDRAAWTQETADLDSIADALAKSIVRTKSIPTYTNWASAVASYMSLPVSAITTNPRRNARAFLIDPNANINGVDVSTVPYTQSTNGTTKPSNARVILVSSLAGTLPVSSAPQLAADFNAIWDTPDGGTPAGWSISGDHLRIKKLNLEPLFHQLILLNHNASAGRFAIDASGTGAVPSGGLGLNKYYLDGTVIRLHGADDVPQTRHLLQRNISFVFESGVWFGQIEGGQTTLNNTNAADFLNRATTFYNASWNTGSQQGASQTSVLVAMYTFMFDYVFWATQCPHFNDHGNSGSPASVPEYKMLHDIGQTGAGIDKFSLDLLSK